MGRRVASFVIVLVLDLLLSALLILAALVIVYRGVYLNWKAFIVALLISSVIGTVIHEGGHILMALGRRWPIGEVRLGSGPGLVHFRYRGAVVRVGRWPFGGGKVWLAAGVKLGNRERILFAASGAAVNAAAAALALGFVSWSPTVLTAFFCANAFMAVGNLFPGESDESGPTDGKQIFIGLGLLAPQNLGVRRHANHVGPTPTKLEDLALERWTASADQALSTALRIAEAAGAAQLRTEHLLAAVLADEESPGARTLNDMGFSGDRLLPLLAKGASTEPPTWSSEALSAVVFAIAIADPDLGAGTGELCAGVLGATKGRGCAVLNEADITYSGFREELEPLRNQELQVGCTKAIHFLWHVRASARLQSKRNAEARADYIVMTPLAPHPHDQAVDLNNTAWTSLLLGNPAWRADALVRAQQAFAIEPDQPFIRGTLAYALLENGKPAEALAALDSIDQTKSTPKGRASNLCVRAIAEVRLGHADASTRHVHEAEALDPACELLDRTRAELALIPRT